MSVEETVAALVQRIRDARQPVQGEWVDERGSVIAWEDEHAGGRIVIAGRPTLAGPHRPGAFATHPAVFVLDEDERWHYAAGPEIALASWVLADGALDAMLAAGVDAEYARAAHRAGVTDAWTLIGGWEAGIPIEYVGLAS